VHDFKLEKVEKDPFYEGKTAATVSFWLDKGAYATTALRELMKNDSTPTNPAEETDEQD
jgi:tRNA(Glu) U13 pseudouridine synthase TruD